MTDGKSRGPGRKVPLRAVPSTDVPATLPTRLPVDIRGRQKLALIRDLAMGEWEPTSLAPLYGLTAIQVRVFQERHQEEIQEVAHALEGTLDITTAGMWISRKQNRLAEYQQAIDDIDAQLNEWREQGLGWSRAHRDLYRARLDLYRQAADELGAYPQRTAPPARQGLGVQYVIDSDEQGDMT
jgi:hypothetical protein